MDTLELVHLVIRSGHGCLNFWAADLGDTVLSKSLISLVWINIAKTYAGRGRVELRLSQGFKFLQLGIWLRTSVFLFLLPSWLYMLLLWPSNLTSIPSSSAFNVNLHIYILDLNLMLASTWLSNFPVLGTFKLVHFDL